MTKRRLIAIWLCLLAGLPMPVAAEALVAAASSLRGPLDEVIARFQAQTGVTVRVSYGASGNLTHQILRGAPHEIFLSADTAFPARLADAGRVRTGPIVYAVGRLVLYAPDASPVSVEGGLAGIGEALEAGTLRHVALADTRLAPYGRAARQALEHAGLWDSLAGHVVAGRSVAQAAQLVLSGSVDAALVSLSLATTPRLAEAGRYREVPAGGHEPLRHAMVLLNRAGSDAVRLFGYLNGGEVRDVFARHGFAVSGGADRRAIDTNQ